MNPPLFNTIAKALPSASRQCQFRTAPFHLIRSFSSSQRIRLPEKGDIREMERNLLGMAPKSSQDNADNGWDAITNEVISNRRRRAGLGPSQDLTKVLGSLQDEVIPRYADRTSAHNLYIYSHKHNTHLTLTRPNGDPLMGMSCGNLGFRKSARAGFDPAYQLTSHFFAKVHEKGIIIDIQRLNLIFRDFGPGRDAFVKVLLGNEGRSIRGLVGRVTDATRIKFGGTRSRHVRRLG